MNFESVSLINTISAFEKLDRDIHLRLFSYGYGPAIRRLSTLHKIVMSATD
jgi:hypothetical protein